MKRWPFTILAAVSLLLCIATVALWVRSYWRLDVGSFTEASAFVIWSYSGNLELLVSNHPNKPNQGFGYDSVKLFPSPYSPRRYAGESKSWLGFGYNVAQRYKVVYFPHWFLALLFAILPATWLIGTIRSGRRRVEKHCDQCGYDLRATPDRCPECGAETVSRTS